MTATLTRLGTLTVSSYEHYEQTEVGERISVTHSIAGVSIRLDAEPDVTAGLWGGQEYRVAPNDGWFVERRGLEVAGRHWAHLVDADGRAVTELPTADGPVTLHRDREYLIRQEPSRTWCLYEVR